MKSVALNLPLPPAPSTAAMSVSVDAVPCVVQWGISIAVPIIGWWRIITFTHAQFESSDTLTLSTPGTCAEHNPSSLTAGACMALRASLCSTIGGQHRVGPRRLHLLQSSGHSGCAALGAHHAGDVQAHHCGGSHTTGNHARLRASIQLGTLRLGLLEELSFKLAAAPSAIHLVASR